MSSTQPNPLITNTLHLENSSSISEYYKQLHRTIDDMDNKVEGVIKKHQAQFLFAYRNHIKKIKKELAEIKQKSEQQQKMFSSNDRIQYLEKQITIFRQEALKLYDKLQAKTQEAEIYRNKIKQNQKEYQQKEKQAKELLKSAKLSQAGRNMYVVKIEQLEQMLRMKNEQIERLNSKLAQRNMSHLSYMSEKSSMQKNEQSSPLKLSKYERSSSNKKSMGHAPLFKNTIHDSQLKDWFLQCIRTVKRQIAQRKTYTSGNSSVDLKQIANIDQFRMVDKLRLLQIFMQNEKLLVWMYQKIFPDRLSEIKGYLTKKEKISTPSQNLKLDPEFEMQEESRPTSNMLPKVIDVKWKKSQIRNRISIKNGKLNLSSY